MLGKAMLRMIESLKRVNDDLLSLSHAAVEGNLDKRAKATEHQGTFASIINGLNQLLDAMVVPVNEASDVLEKAARKDLCNRMNGKYKGKFAEIMKNVNGTLEALDRALSQVSDAVLQVNNASGQIAKWQPKSCCGSQPAGQLAGRNLRQP